MSVVDLKQEAADGVIVWFARTSKVITEKNCENEINMGQIVGSAVEAFEALFRELYIPLLGAQDNWGQAPQSLVQSFLQVTWDRHLE